MIVWQIIAVLIVLTAVVAVHELGHYLFARWKGMEVEEFCILGLPFGKKVILHTTKTGMNITTHPFVPLGGFVRVKGMEPKPDGSEVDVPQGFYSKGTGARAWVLFAGPLFSVLFGYVLFAAGYMLFGEKRPVTAPVIGSIADPSPAKDAGLEIGDRVVRANGQPITTFYDLRVVTREVIDEPMSLDVERDGQTLSLTITPKLLADATIVGPDNMPEYDESGSIKKANVGWIGVGPAFETVSVGFVGSFKLAAEKSWSILSGTVRVLMKPRDLKENAGGPITIAKFTGEAATEGPYALFLIAAIISLSLGILNLLPIPFFDGGQLVICGIEALRGGKRLSFKIQERVAVVGFALVLLLIISVFWLDISRLVKG
ncbi:MAG: RIP metalloprotease [Fimbriimonadales bacterium]|nr:RIP metalloprotease [Fimbriimonadales bacterium]